MIELEHFKICVRAYCPDHDFGWLLQWNVSFVSLAAMSFPWDPDSPEPVDDEAVLMEVLKKFNRHPAKRNLEFLGDLVLLTPTETRDCAVVLRIERICADERLKELH